MKILETVQVVQFFLYEEEEIEIKGNTAFFGPNGAGKSALLDAVQIVMLACDAKFIDFNAQADTGPDARSIRDYCLGIYGQTDAERARDSARTYINLVFTDSETGVPFSAGVCIEASVDRDTHNMRGLFIAPGVALPVSAFSIENSRSGNSPIEWNLFRTQLAERCKRIGTSVLITDVRETFSRELLHQLCGKIGDYHAFRMAFKRALNLQRIASVDSAIRDYMVEKRPTNVRKFRRIVESCNELRRLVAEVKAKIDQGEKVEREYDRAATEATRLASMKALEKTYEVEWNQALLEETRQLEEAAREELDSAAHKRRGLDFSIERKEKEVLDLHDRIKGHRAYSSEKELLEQIERHGEAANRAGLQRREYLVKALDGLQRVANLSIPDVAAGAVAKTEQRLRATCDTEDPSAVEQTNEALKDALEIIKKAYRFVDDEKLSRKMTLQGDEAFHRQLQLDSARAAIGRAALSDDASRLLSELKEAGVEAIPVCDLVRVSDAAWQPAIEAYLRSHVEALLVPEQDEARAFAVYRNLRGSRAIYGVKLALSSHARRWNKSVDETHAASLIVGADDAAVKYLRMQLGNLRRVDGEKEAVAADKALTRDGMLVKGGSVERLRLPVGSELKLGASSDRSQRAYLDRQLREVTAQIAARRNEIEESERLLTRFAWGFDSDVLQRCQRVVAEWADSVLALEAARQKHQEGRNPELAGLSERHDKADRELDDLRKEQIKIVETIGAVERELKTHSEDTKRYAEALEQERSAEAACKNAPEYDPAILERERQAIDREIEEPVARIQRCREKSSELYERHREKTLPTAREMLADFRRDFNVDIDKRYLADWQEGRRWIKDHIGLLKNSDLVRYQQQSEDAYESAVQSFRTDVASTIADNFERMRLQMDAFNRTLRQCPAFTNGERYKYRATVVESLRPLYSFIMKVGKSGAEDDLFGGPGEVPEVFKELLDGQISDDVDGQNPLDDYRRFFVFDVEIERDGRSVGVLSKRIGPASGGEGRAPLYVITGAALATAYGAVIGQSKGAGLMLIDEAFVKMDSENPIATAGYLQGLGLQLVMAAPDTSLAFTTPLLDRYYEMFRVEDCIELVSREVSDKAKELMASDLYQAHPELLDEEIARVKAQEKARDAVRS